jgi:hypothetical protein
MDTLRRDRSSLAANALIASFVLVVMAAGVAFGQAEGEGSIFLPNQEVRVTDLPPLTAASTSRPAVLATALEIVIHDKAVCCGKDSTLEDAVQYAALSDSVSLKELGARLQGKHLLSDARRIMVNADYVPQSAIGPGLMIGALREQHAQIMEWKSHLYVLYGAIFNETRFYRGESQYAIVKLLLLDPRFSDQRKEVVFDRETDDWGKVQGFLTVAVVRR